MSAKDDKDPNVMEIPENAEPLEEKNSSGERKVNSSSMDDVESPELNTAPAELESDIDAKRRRIENWVGGLQEATEAQSVYGLNSLDSPDGGMLSPIAESSESPTATELISNQREFFEGQLEFMYTAGLFERDETKHAPGQGYFRRILATLGTCSDLLNSIVITFQTNSVPREATLQRTLEEVSNYLLEGDVICLRRPCQDCKTLQGEGNMTGLKKSITDLFNMVNDAIKDIKVLLVIEDKIASLEAEFHGDEADD